MEKQIFFIVGFAKSGTETLMRYFLDHDEVFMHNTESGFFSHHYDEKKIDAFKKYLINETNKDQKEYKVFGEKSAWYFVEELNCAEKIKKHFPQAKIIFMLRNPIDRTFSQYLHNVRKGEEQRTFKDSLYQELRISTNNFEKKYLYCSNYYIHLKKYYDMFDKESIYLSIFENFLINKQKELNKMCDFLNIKHFDKINSYHLNKSYNYFGSKYLPYFKSKFFKNIFYKFYKKLISNFRKKIPQNDMKKFLKDIFIKDCFKLKRFGIEFEKYWFR